MGHARQHSLRERFRPLAVLGRRENGDLAADRRDGPADRPGGLPTSFRGGGHDDGLAADVRASVMVSYGRGSVTTPLPHGRGSDQMLDLHKQLSAAKMSHEKTAIQRQIDATDRRIDRLVYELYNLTDEEIHIVEEATHT